MPQRERCRPISWRGQPTPDALEATRWYVEETRRYWAEDEDPYYVPALPCEESKGEP